MQDYGGESQKPTWLYSNYNILDTLDDYVTGQTTSFGKAEMVKTSKNKHTGKLGFSAGKDLKTSQHYPKNFGLAVRKTSLKHERYIRCNMARLCGLSKNTRNHMTNSSWADADISSVIEYLLK